MVCCNNCDHVRPHEIKTVKVSSYVRCDCPIPELPALPFAVSPFSISRQLMNGETEHNCATFQLKKHRAIVPTAQPYLEGARNGPADFPDRLEMALEAYRHTENALMACLDLLNNDASPAHHELIDKMRADMLQRRSSKTRTPRQR